MRDQRSEIKDPSSFISHPSSVSLCVFVIDSEETWAQAAGQNTTWEIDFAMSATAMEVMPTRPIPQEYPANRIGV